MPRKHPRVFRERKEPLYAVFKELQTSARGIGTPESGTEQGIAGNQRFFLCIIQTNRAGAVAGSMQNFPSGENRPVMQDNGLFFLKNDGGIRQLILKPFDHSPCPELLKKGMMPFECPCPQKFRVCAVNRYIGIGKGPGERGQGDHMVKMPMGE